MRPLYRVRISACILGGLALILSAGPAPAQLLYEDARRLLELSPDPIARAPRLLGMGRLSLVIDDPQNRITLWDFAGNPTGVLDADTSSTLDLRPSTWSTSHLHDQPGFSTAAEREDLAARETRVGFEAWHRTPKSNVYGAIGDVAGLELNQPSSRSIEQRSNFRQPTLTSISNGRMPLVFSDRMLYAIRIHSGYESSTDKFWTITRNGAGEYVGLKGQAYPSSDFFTPDEVTIKTLGIGAALAYRLGSIATLAAGIDQLQNHIDGENNGNRHDSEISENRPYTIGQLSMVGRYVGKGLGLLEWGGDARGWKANSDQKWVFTISSGTAAFNSGRGHFARREEKGSTLRTRVRWAIGSIEVGAAFNTAYQKIDLTAPDANDTTSFNHFRNLIFSSTDTDSLSLPDSVVSNLSEQRAWEAGGGLSWRPPLRHTVVGIEYHRRHDLFQQDLSGRGPKRESWDVRSGFEYGLGPVVSLRGGYIYRWEDLDAFTRDNEFVGHTATVGLGLAPLGASWSTDLGYGFGWSRADYGDPGKPRATSHQLAFRVHWAF